MIYVASSWRNYAQQFVVVHLRAAGLEVYDFRHPGELDTGFRWDEIDPKWRDWDLDSYQAGLKDPRAEKGFRRDRDALAACHTCVMVLPCGASAHLEFGWAIGQGKPGAIYVPPGASIEPELMYKFAEIHGDVERIVEFAFDAE